MPFGAKSFDPEKISYLSPEQALADYAVLITHLKETLPGAKNCPVFAYVLVMLIMAMLSRGAMPWHDSWLTARLWVWWRMQVWR
jgi:hypothetical protein